MVNYKTATTNLKYGLNQLYMLFIGVTRLWSDFMPENYQVILQELIRRSNEETRRLKSVEQRMDSLEDKVNILVENDIERTKKANTRIADIDVNMKDLLNEVTNLKTNVDKISRQLAKFAQKRDLKEIEHLIELITPVPEERKAHDVRIVRVS